MIQIIQSSAVNLSLHKKERALVVKLFYQNDSNSLAAFRANRRMKKLRREHTCVNAVKLMIRKCEVTGSLDVDWEEDDIQFARDCGGSCNCDT